MSRISDMSMEAIYRKIPFYIKENDGTYFGKNADFVNMFKMFLKRSVSQEEIIQFLIENEESIDKEKLVLTIIANYQGRIAQLTQALKDVKSKISMIGLNEYAEAIKTPEVAQIATRLSRNSSKVSEDIKRYEKLLKRALELGRYIDDTLIPYYYYDIEKKHYRVYVIDSRKIIKGQRGTSNLPRLKKFNSFLNSKHAGITDRNGTSYYFYVCR